MSKILVPTDFSEQAEYALSLAHQMAGRMNAEIVLIHIVDVPQGSQVSINVTGEVSGSRDMNDVFFIKLIEKTKQRFADIKERSEFSNIKITDKIQMGSPYRQIVEEAKNGDVDLIIMGTTGTSGWEEEIVGSNAEKVVRRAKCPVLTVSNKIDTDEIKDIAFVSDFKHEHSRLVDLVKEIRDILKAKLHLVKINTPSDFKNDKQNYAELKSYAKDNKFDEAELHVYNYENEEDGIISFSEEFNMNMIIMATEGRSGFSRLLEGSIAEDVVNYSKIPVLTYRTEKP